MKQIRIKLQAKYQIKVEIKPASSKIDLIKNCMEFVQAPAKIAAPHQA
jgi:hypothetical protein